MGLIQPYANNHHNPSGPGDGRPTAIQIVEDQQLLGKWAGRVALVTGCSPGSIGAEIARAIHATGADVYITSRDTTKGLVTAQSILADGNPGKVEVIQLDLTSLESVRKAAQTFLEKSQSLHLLINNAGVLGCPRQITGEGVDAHFAANYLGHFLLFQLLKASLLASTRDFEVRVVNVASVAHRLGTYDLDDLAFEHRTYEASTAYAASKLATVHFANEVERRFGAQGLHAFSVDPGITVTPLTKDTPEIVSMMDKYGASDLRKSPEQGAATPIWAAVARELKGKGGQYLEHCGETELCTEGGFLATGYGENAYDQATEQKLWIKSLGHVGMDEEK
ncbi:hypothetical protein B0J15DRAFT_517860 [Fusarium solani]|uniref:Uncharacterized protein n=2 Tax=Fusarium solani TaxID=169388 RepID=A0A9P9G5U9_FUSSL|nr:uncharacterized protein B0J15DRAFT_517860 [Fusarium solani]KAH7231894.1 hypothetical protein B0J15DRAFT_517860 [Fusarium solani]